MLRNRIIPVLLLRDGGLVKTTKFANPRYIGDPLNAIKIFNEKKVDELLVLDITASKEARGPDFDVVQQFATECFMPFCYGGGITSLEHAERLFALGVEKVSVQSATATDMNLLTQIASKFGSQAVAASIDIKKSWMGAYQLYWAANGTTDKNWQAHLQRVVEAGAGEVVLNSVDRDGTMEGVDTALIEMAAKSVKVPLVAVGGVGSLQDILCAIRAGASAVGAGSFFVFHGKHRAVLITYPEYAALEALLASEL